MNTKAKTLQKIIGLIVLMTLTRLIPHPWNFTPLIAGSLYLGFSLPVSFAIIASLVSMILGDIFLGLYFSSISVYLSIFAITFMGRFIKNISALRVAGFSFLGSTFFFLVTNFSVWLTMPMYEKSLLGLVKCYTLALPFYGNTLLSSLLYAGVFFGAHAFYKSRCVLVFND